MTSPDRFTDRSVIFDGFLKVRLRLRISKRHCPFSLIGIVSLQEKQRIYAKNSCRKWDFAV